MIELTGKQAERFNKMANDNLSRPKINFSDQIRSCEKILAKSRKPARPIT